MEYSDWDGDFDESAYPAQYEHRMLQMQMPISNKIPPSFNGRTSFFAYEEAINDWVDVTELSAERQGPALKSNLVEDALVCRELLDRDALKNAATGVTYYKNFLRTYFVKGAQTTFLWRFFNIFKFYRGQRDIRAWLTRMVVLKRRIEDCWMDMFVNIPADDIRFQNVVAAVVAQLGLAQDEAGLARAHQQWNEQRRIQHRTGFPLGDNLFALMLIVLADLNENQREQLSNKMNIMGHHSLENYTFDLVKNTMIEIFLTSRSSLNDPSVRPISTVKSFLVLDEGEMDGLQGHWVEEEETGDEGFLPLFEDNFWVHNEESDAWANFPFRGRIVRKGQSKGRGKGKGRKGRRRNQKGGKGKGQFMNNAHWGGEDEESSAWTKGKGKGKGKRTFKGKGKGKDEGKGKGFQKGFGKNNSEGLLAIEDQQPSILPASTGQAYATETWPAPTGHAFASES